MKRFVWLGDGVYVPLEKVILIADYNEPQSKKLVKSAKESGKLYDFTRGAKKKSIVLISTGGIIISPYESWQIKESAEDAELEKQRAHRKAIELD